MRLLVAEDDTKAARFLVQGLEEEGHAVDVAADGNTAAQLGQVHPYDVIVLDVMLPGLDGMEVCRRIRAESGVPIVMLTARTDTVDVVVGLESGADDYVVKPFKPQELIARVRARLRRGDEPAPEKLTIGDLEIDVAGHSVRRDGKALSLTPLEFDLLVAFLDNAQRVVARERLIELSRARIGDSSDRSIDVLVSRLRRKLSGAGGAAPIVTVRGVGYMLNVPVERR